MSDIDRITEPQEWIDGLIEKYAPNSHDIDVAIQNMGMKIKELSRNVRVNDDDVVLQKWLYDELVRKSRKYDEQNPNIYTHAGE